MLSKFILVFSLFFVPLSHFAGAAETSSKSSRLLREGDTLPSDVIIKSIDGKMAKTGDFSHKPILINLWTSWCSGCEHEMSGLYVFYKKYHPKGLQIISLNMDEKDPKSDVARSNSRLGPAPFSSFRGEESSLSKMFYWETGDQDPNPTTGKADPLGEIAIMAGNSKVLPLSIFVDKNSIIKYIRPAAIDFLSAETQKMVDSLF